MPESIKKMIKKMKINGPTERSAQFNQETINLEARTVELSFSSEEPYDRYWGVEILGHDATEVRLGRLNNSGAFLMDHNTRDQVGVIEKAQIGEDRKGRAIVRFGRSARAEEIFQDVIDGIRKNVSVSYEIHKMKLIKSEQAANGKDMIETFRVTDWEPLEVSLVSVPADATVGIGRDRNDNAREIQIEIPNKEEKRIMDKCKICGADLVDGKCPACARAKAEAQRDAQLETARINEIMAMGKKHNLMDDAMTFIMEKKSIDDFKNHVIEKISAPARELDNQQINAATSPDQPIYRGSGASQFGQQLLDIRIMSKPDQFKSDEVSAARSRLEHTQRRNQALLEARLNVENRAAATGGLATANLSDGAFFMQGETAIDLVTNGFNNSEVLPRCSVRTLNAGTQFVEVIGVDETSRANGSRGGGVTVYTTAELDAMTASKPKFNKIRIEPKKLTGLYYGSGEMMNNVTFLGQEMRQLFGEEFAYKIQDQVINGTGAGEALGILNAACTVSVGKETGQKAATILSKNLSKMWARFRGKNPVWLINRDTNPELDELAITVGTAALEPRFVNYGPEGTLRIKGAPVVEIEQCQTLGTTGDIYLADFSQYITANRGDIMEAMSIELMFIYDQNTYRFIYHFDGQPRWKSAITPAKGSNTTSPFVKLDTR